MPSPTTQDSSSLEPGNFDLEKDLLLLNKVMFILKKEIKLIC